MYAPDDKHDDVISCLKIFEEIFNTDESVFTRDRLRLIIYIAKSNGYYNRFITRLKNKLEELPF